MTNLLFNSAVFDKFKNGKKDFKCVGPPFFATISYNMKKIIFSFEISDISVQFSLNIALFYINSSLCEIAKFNPILCFDFSVSVRNAGHERKMVIIPTKFEWTQFKNDLVILNIVETV